MVRVDIRVDTKKGGPSRPAYLIVTTHEPCWIRTSDPLLKRQMLYRLS